MSGHTINEAPQTSIGTKVYSRPQMEHLFVPLLKMLKEWLVPGITSENI